MKTIEVSNDLAELLRIGAESGGVNESEEIDSESIPKWLEKKQKWTYYGHGTADYAESAVRLKDGSILVVITIKSFAGTFASYDDVHVEWWQLIPETEEEREYFIVHRPSKRKSKK
jgi:hypothetical protein